MRSRGVGLDPAAGGDADLHVGHLGPDGGDRVADVHRVERLLRVRVARVDVHRGDAQPGDRAGVPGQVAGQHRAAPDARPPGRDPFRTACSTAAHPHPDTESLAVGDRAAPPPNGDPQARRSLGR